MGRMSNRLPLLAAAMPAPLSRSPGYSAGNFSMRVSGSRSAENERTVGATEPEGIGKGVFDRHLTRGIRHVIQIAALARGMQIDGRRRDLIAQCQHAENRFDDAGFFNEMAGHRFYPASLHVALRRAAP